MHEMGIAKSLLEIIKREMRKSKVKKLKKVRVKIGERTAVEPEALRFCFEASIKDTDLDGARHLAEEAGRARLGLFFRDPARPRYDELRALPVRTVEDKLRLLEAEFDRHAV